MGCNERSRWRMRDWVRASRGARKAARRGLGQALAIATALAGCMALPAMAAAATGSIEGVVTEAAAAKGGIEGLCVAAYAPGGSRYAGAAGVTGPAGKYKIEALSDGSYDVELFKCSEEFRLHGVEGNAALNFVPRFYNETAAGAPALSGAKAVKIEAGKQAATGVDAEMKTGGEIEGKLLGEAGQPLGGVCVTAYSPSGGTLEFINTVSKAPDGEYLLTGLPSGAYVIQYFGCEKQNVVFAYYDEAVASSHRGVSSEDATEVAVVAEKEPASVVHVAEVRLEAGGVIEGNITESAGNAIEAMICVEAGSTSSEELGGFTITTTGHYKIEGLASGAYDLIAGECGSSKPVWATQYFNGVGKLSEATPVSVTAGLEPPVPASANFRLVRASALKPASTVAPGVGGTAVAGATLTCSPGGWSGAPAPTYSYQWLREGSAIAGATGATYVVQTADEGYGLACRVTASNEAGSTSETSAAVTVAKKPPLPKPGTAVVGAKALVKAGVAQLSLSCVGEGACSGSLRLTRTLSVAKGKHHKPKHVSVVIGEASFSIAAGGHETLAVRLTGRGKSLLAKAGSGGLSVQLGGIDTESRTVLLKSAAKKGKRK